MISAATPAQQVIPKLPGVFLSPPSLLYSHLKIETKIERMADLKQLMDNEVLMAFASYATIILTKMMLMSSATAFQRLTNKVRVQWQHFLTFKG